jgi:hypothetical protein
MRDEQRIEKILYKIGKLWVLNPDQRLGQLLANYTRFGTRINGEIGVVRDIFFYEDSDIEKDLDLSLSAHECAKRIKGKRTIKKR